MTATMSRHALASVDAGDDMVLSAQLDLSGDRQIERSYRVAFDDMARRYRAALARAAWPAFDREVDRVREYLAALMPAGAGLVIHSCEPLGLWHVVAVPTPIPNEIALGRFARVRSLLDFVDEHEPSAVALVDSEEARVFLLERGQVVDSWDLLSLVPGRHKQGGWSQANYQRHHDNVVDVHLRTVCDQLVELGQRQPYRRLIIGGPVEPVTRLQELLPRTLRERLAGTFEAEMFASNSETLDRASAVLKAAERESEERVVAQLREGAHDGGAAVLGFTPTLAAVAARQARTLVVASATSQQGASCPSCGGLFVGALSICPACGKVVETVGDVVDEAMRRTIVSGGDVEVTHGVAAAELLAIGAGIGALLRYAAG